MGHYITKSELSRAVRESQAQCRMTDELAQMISLIAVKFAATYAPTADHDDVAQDAVVSLMVSLSKIDPDRDVFNYVTTTVQNLLRQHYRGRCIHTKLLASLWAARRPLT